MNNFFKIVTSFLLGLSILVNLSTSVDILNITNYPTYNSEVSLQFKDGKPFEWMR